MDHLMSPPPWRVRGMQILAAVLLAACGGGGDMPSAVSNGGSAARWGRPMETPCPDRAVQRGQCPADGPGTIL